MSAEELKQLYLSQKDEIALNITLYTSKYEDLIILGNNLIPVLDEYGRSVSKTNSMSKDMVLGDINLQLSLLSQYLTQIKKFKRRLVESYDKSEKAVQAALSSGNSGDLITAQGAYGGFDKEYRGVPSKNNASEYVGGANDKIKEYGVLLATVRKDIGSIGKDVFKILPRDDSGKIFKKEDDPEENIKMMMADNNVRIFLLIMIGLLGYYLFIVDFSEAYEDDWYDDRDSRYSMEFD